MTDNDSSFENQSSPVIGWPSSKGIFVKKVIAGASLLVIGNV